MDGSLWHKAALEKKTLMPLVRIDLPVGKPADYTRTVADVVYNAMIATLKRIKE